MSSRLCKKLEGAVFPVEVKALEDRVNNSIHALYIDKADHGPGSPPDFHKAAFDDVGGAQLTPQVFGKAEEAQQLGQIALQLPYHRRILFLPVHRETSIGRLRGSAVSRLVDGLGVDFHCVIVGLTNLLITFLFC